MGPDLGRTTSLKLSPKMSGDDQQSAFTWTPSVCESFSSQSIRNVTPDCWETCDWSGNEEKSNNGDDWEGCSDWSLPAEEESSFNNLDFSFSPPVAESTPRKNRVPKFQFAYPLESPSASQTQSLLPVRKSPRAAAVLRPRFDPSRVVTNEDGWQLSSVIDSQGCQPRCCKEVHGLSEYDVLIAHSSFSSKSPADRRAWLLEYFDTNCPHNEQGEKDPKCMQYILCGRLVCRAIWQAVLLISTSTFYSLRKTRNVLIKMYVCNHCLPSQ